MTAIQNAPPRVVQRAIGAKEGLRRAASTAPETTTHNAAPIVPSTAGPADLHDSDYMSRRVLVKRVLPAENGHHRSLPRGQKRH